MSPAMPGRGRSPGVKVRPQSDLRSLIDHISPRAVAVRRVIHADPELSGHEVRTAALIHRHLTSIGLRPRFHVGKTGVAASLRNGPGKTIVLRADTDALPIGEQTGLPFSSRRPGIMHACGHDLHTACLLGAAEVIYKMRSRINGAVVFLFQPSEEQEPGGAVKMIAEGAFPPAADAVFALHVSTDHAAGEVGLRAGSDCSGMVSFEAIVKGRGGHGASPETTIDPIVCASAMILGLQTLISRERPPFEPAVITVGTFHAGARQNIIPDQARFEGTIRTFTAAAQAHFKRRVAEFLKSTAAAYRAGVEVRFLDSYPPGHNDPALTDTAAKALSRYLPSSRIVTRPHPTMFAEDFSYYQQKAPGVLLHLGVRRRGDRTPAAIHSAAFRPDERAITTGIMVHCALVLELLGKG